MTISELLAAVDALDHAATKDWKKALVGNLATVTFGEKGYIMARILTGQNDADFIAQSRTLLPLAAKRLREAEKKIDDLENDIKTLLETQDVITENQSMVIRGLKSRLQRLLRKLLKSDECR